MWGIKMNERTFNNKRLKEARLYREMTIEELANIIEVSKQAISQFEKNTNKPTLETIKKIENALGFPKEYFYQFDKPEEVIEGNTYFRALMSMNKKTQMSQKLKVDLMLKLYRIIERYIEFPEADIREVDIDNKNVEEIAMSLREKWDLGESPIKNIVGLMENRGFIVTSLFTGSRDVDAYSKLTNVDGNDYYCVVLGDDKESAVRRQFSAAHELGHCILHNESVDIDLLDREEFKKVEKEANNFAAAFLLPKNAFLKDLIYPINLDYYKELKKKWRVSISAMIRRAAQLGKITDNQYRGLMAKMSKLGYRTNEPLDNTLVTSQPVFLKKAVEMLIDNDVLTPNEFFEVLEYENLSLKQEEVEKLLNLEKGTLDRKEDDEDEFKLRLIK